MMLYIGLPFFLMCLALIVVGVAEWNGWGGV